MDALLPRTRVTFLICLTSIFLSNCPEKLKEPPVAKPQPHITVVHGDTLVDNYAWLRERDNPEVIKYLEAKNQYTESVMRPTKNLQKKLFREMRKRLKETDISVPAKRDAYYYYTRTEKGQQYPIYCRKQGSLEAPEEILLDQNQLAKGHRYLHLGIIAVSPNHQYLAYSIDTKGSEEYTVFFKDLASGKQLPDTLVNTSYGFVWANDNATVFYTTLDKIKRPDKLWRHKLGTDPAQDVLVYMEPDEKYNVSIERSRSNCFLFLTLNSNITTECYFLEADRPEGNFRLIAPRKEGVEYYVDHRADQFYLLTNEQAVNFRLMQTAVTKPERQYWQEILPHRKDIMLDGIDLFQNHLIVYEREQGLKKVRIYNFTTGNTSYLPFPDPVYTFDPTGNLEFETNQLRLRYTSLVTPPMTVDYDLNTLGSTVLKQEEVRGGYNSNEYVCERIYATANDGTAIPISLVYKKGLNKDGNNPLYLYGYGAYGSSTEPRFSAARLSLLNRGFIYAIAHIRGGGELGRTWYEDGKWLKKKNTFDDFIACAEHLIRTGYTRPEKLVIGGGSAGGLLMGAVVNARPDLFRVVIAHVPFVDVLNTMLDPSIPLTVTEYDEWGNPNLLEYYNYIKSYSPYDNVQPVAYPAMLITAGLNDPRVAYWEPAKWTAKLRVTQTGKNPIILKTDMGKGHFGASGRYDYLKELAFEYAFIFQQLQIKE